MTVRHARRDLNQGPDSLSKRVKVFDHHSGLNKLKNPWTTGISVSLAWSYIEQALNLYDSETRQERFKPGFPVKQVTTEICLPNAGPGLSDTTFVEPWPLLLIFFSPGGRVPGLGRPQVRAPQWGTPCVDWSRCSARPGSCKARHSDRRTQEIPCSGTWILDFLITRVRITSEKDSCGLLLHSTWKYFPCKLHKPFLIDCFSKQTFTLFKSCLHVVILFAAVEGWCSAIPFEAANSQ